MAKIVLTISADNKATQSVKLLNAEVQTLSKTLSTIKVNKNLTTQINALTKHYTALAKAAVRVNEATTKRQIAEQRLANEVKRGRTEDQRTLKVKAQKEQAELRLKQAQDKATQSTQKQTTATKQGTKVNEEHRQSILSMTRGILEWQIATTLVMKPLRMLQNALQSINETLVKTEDAVIALQRVLPSGSASNSEISSRLYKIAQDYGQTFENVQQIATNFARTGMSWADTIKATEAAVLALNVAELDATEASDGLISILTQFNKETSDLTEVVDKLNKAADNNPVTTEKLLKALQRTGAAANQANISLDETVGIITTLSKATNRSGENLGTAVNSLIQFSSKASSLDTFAKFGGSVETAVEKFRAGGGSILEIWQKLSEVIKDRKGNAESILGDGIFSDDEWAGLNEELKEALGEAYADVTDIYDTASTFRKNYFIALLNDMDNVKKVTDEIANANGYSQAENQKYLDTYTAKLNTLKAQWEDIANSEQGLLGIKKVFVDIGSVLLTVVKWTGGLRTTLIAISSLVFALKGAKIVAGIKSIGTAIKGLVTGLKTAATAAQGLQTAFGWIGLIATAASAIVGIFQQVAESRKEAETQSRADAISNWDSVEDDAKSLINLYNRFENLSGAVNRTAEEERDWLSIQDDIISKLGDKALILKTLTEGTQEYVDKLRELTKEEIEENAKTARAAANATSTFSAGTSEYLYNKPKPLSSQNKEKINAFDFYLDDKTKEYLLNNGFTLTDKNNVGDLVFAEKNQWDVYRNRVVSSGDYFKDYQRLTDISDALFKSEDFNRSDDYTSVQNALKVLYDNLKTQVVNETAAQYYEFRLNNDFEDISSQAQFDDIVKNIMTATGATEEFKGEIIAALLALTKFKKEETDKFWSNNIQDAKTEYEDLIKTLKELRDLEDESANLEEKKAEYLEEQNELIKAQQALENAKNEATVRRFNEATGQWEWQVDEKKVQSAEEAVKKQEESVEKAREQLEKQAYDTIISLLDKNNPPTNDELVDLLDGLKDFLGEQFITDIKEAFLKDTNVDLDKPINEKPTSDSTSNSTEKTYTIPSGIGRATQAEKDGILNALKNGDYEAFKRYMPSAWDEEKKRSAYLKSGGVFDSGGIANGLGFMVKATAEPEVVNAPDIARKILDPVSSKEFESYTRQLGIMYEQAHNYARMPQFERVNNSTDNRVDNSRQVFVNGVNVGAEKRETLLDILEVSKIVPN